MADAWSSATAPVACATADQGAGARLRSGARVGRRRWTHLVALSAIMLIAVGCEPVAPSPSTTASTPAWAFSGEPPPDGEWVDGWRGGMAGLPAGLVEGYALENYGTAEAVVARLAETLSDAWSEVSAEVSASAHSVDDTTAIGILELRTPPDEGGDADLRLWLRSRDGAWAIYAAAGPCQD